MKVHILLLVTVNVINVYETDRDSEHPEQQNIFSSSSFGQSTGLWIIHWFIT